MKIAIVGTGIAGLVAAHRLQHEHELTIYEAGDWIGGHTHTIDLEVAGRRLAVDSGFIVFNRQTYPDFCALLEELGVPWQESEMSFSVRCEQTRLEYNGSSLNGLFAQRGNLLNPSFWRLLRDVQRFYQQAPAWLARPADAQQGATLGEFLEAGRYSREFIEQHLIPMGSAIWSARPAAMLDFPLRFLLQFFHNHGFLQLEGRPRWLVVRGGSARYVEALVAPLRERILLRTPVVKLERSPAGVLLRSAGGPAQRFDRVVLACHADQSLRLLSDATAAEREVLGAFAYQRNEVVLHTDVSLMPQQRRAWASWNYYVARARADLPTVTYWMNRLQGLSEAKQYLVTLNRTQDIDPAQVLQSFVYHHPIYSLAAVRAQARHAEIDGARDVHFCGAYWGFGFHEDGVRSALAVVRRLGAEVAA